MLTLGYFSKFPAKYRDRESSVAGVIIQNIKVTKQEDSILVESNTDKYEQAIEIHDKTIHLNSTCKVFCSCPSFKFEFANILFRNDSLLNPTELIRSIMFKPKEKNEFNIPSGCKHIVALSRKIIKLRKF